MATSVISMQGNARERHAVWGRSITITLPDDTPNVLIMIYDELYCVWMAGGDSLFVRGFGSSGLVAVNGNPAIVPPNSRLTISRSGQTLTISVTSDANITAIY